MQILPLSLHTIYAELLERVQMDAFDRDFPPTGSFVARKIRDRTYWYFNQHQPALKGRRTKQPSGTRQKYVGPDSAELRKRIEQHGRHKQSYRDRRDMVRALRQAGLTAPSAFVGDLLEALSAAGVFRLRTCLIGTAAFQTYWRCWASNGGLPPL